MKLRVLKCPECRGDLEIEEGRSFCYCQYCGCKITLEDEEQKVAINKHINVTKNITHTNRRFDDAEMLRETNKEKEDKRSWIALLVLLIVALGLMLGPMLKIEIDNRIAQDSGKIHAGNCDDLVGEDYNVVRAHFETAGFTDIELIDLDDSGIAFWTDGKVEMISLGGDASFQSTDWFEPNTKVVISYH